MTKNVNQINENPGYVWHTIPFFVNRSIVFLTLVKTIDNRKMSSFKYKYIQHCSIILLDEYVGSVFIFYPKK